MLLHDETDVHAYPVVHPDSSHGQETRTFLFVYLLLLLSTCFLFYHQREYRIRYDTSQMTVEELKALIWRYFLSYWNNRRICSANGGLPPMIKRRQYYEALELVA